MIRSTITKVEMSFEMTVEEYRRVEARDKADYGDTLLHRIEKIDDDYTDMMIGQINYDGHFGPQIIVEIYVDESQVPDPEIIEKIKHTIEDFII